MDCSKLDCSKLWTGLDCSKLDCSKLWTGLDCSKLWTGLDCSKMWIGLDCSKLWSVVNSKRWTVAQAHPATEGEKTMALNMGF